MAAVAPRVQLARPAAEQPAAWLVAEPRVAPVQMLAACKVEPLVAAVLKVVEPQAVAPKAAALRAVECRAAAPRVVPAVTRRLVAVARTVRKAAVPRAAAEP